MKFNFPKNDTKYLWTEHIKRKMMFYGLSGDRIKRVIRSPKRSEMGVAENTLASMQPSTNSKKPSEVWVMFQKQGNKKVLISAWRYPGTSPVRGEVPIPSDILRELKEEGIIK